MFYITSALQWPGVLFMFGAMAGCLLITTQKAAFSSHEEIISSNNSREDENKTGGQVNEPIEPKVVTNRKSSRKTAEEAMMDLKTKARTKFQKRLMTKKRTCHKYNYYLGPRSKRPLRWYYSKEHNLLFCMNAKAGSTTMKYHFGQLLDANYSHSEWKLKGFRLRNMESVQSLQKLSKKGLDSGLFVFTSVRHPFAHLVSAYFRFLTYINLDFRHDKDMSLGELKDSKSKDNPVTPSDVVEYLLSGKVENLEGLNHFRPYFHSCNYCDFEFDSVIDLSELQDEIQAIANSLNIDVWKRSIHANTRTTPSSSNDTERFFSEISLDMAKKLYEYYKLDFELFGYDPEPYYKYCKNDVDKFV